MSDIDEDKDKDILDEANALLSELEGDVAPPPQVEDPKWGEPIVIGSVAGRDVQVAPPMNAAAAATMEPIGYVALGLHTRVTKLEVTMTRLVGIVAKAARRDAGEADDEGEPPKPAAKKRASKKKAKTKAKRSTTRKR